MPPASSSSSSSSTAVVVVAMVLVLATCAHASRSSFSGTLPMVFSEAMFGSRFVYANETILSTSPIPRRDDTYVSLQFDVNPGCFVLRLITEQVWNFGELNGSSYWIFSLPQTTLYELSVEPCDESEKRVSGTVTFHSHTGYLPVEWYPLVGFFGWMSIVYLIVAVLWVVVSAILCLLG
jgi:hypothetical protein